MTERLIRSKQGKPGKGVGPVLHAGAKAEAVVSAIRSLNRHVDVVDRGSYLRVLVPGVCRVTRAAIEGEMGSPFELPGDLERIMSSFSGRFRVDETEAVWWSDASKDQGSKMDDSKCA
jgi:hypothetical protein